MLENVTAVTAKNFTSREDFPEPPDIQRSFNYGKFSFEFNRHPDKSNLDKFRKLAKEGKFHPWKFPFLVDPDFKIKDGQHRFIVSKEQGYPIYYIQDSDGASPQETMQYNSAGKPFSVPDKLDTLSKQVGPLGDEVRKTLKFYEDYCKGTGITKTFCAQLLFNFGETGGAGTALTEGTFVIKREEETLQLIQWLTDLNKGSWRFDKPFVSALLKIIKAVGDKELVFERLKQHEAKITSEPDAATYVESLLKIFNQGRKNKVTLKKQKLENQEETNA